jgi:hypothetical protein
MEYNFGTLDPGCYFFRPARIKHGHFVSEEGGVTFLLRSDGELFNWYTQNEWVRWGGEATNYGPDGTRMNWSYSSYDMANRPSRRTAHDLEILHRALNYQRERGQADVDFEPHGQGTDAGLLAMAKALDIARFQGVSTESHNHGEIEADWGAKAANLEHPDERTDAQAYNWGQGRPWNQGDPIPAPILSSLPVRSRSRGRWDGDGM